MQIIGNNDDEIVLIVSLAEFDISKKVFLFEHFLYVHFLPVLYIVL
jgi:hypothetical protein